MKTRRTHTRAAAGMTLLTAALLGLSGCTNPDDISSLSNRCPEGTFDLPERDRFCSGEADMAEVEFNQGLGFDEGSPVRMVQRDGFMVLSGKVKGQQELAVLSVPAPGDALSDAGYWKRNMKDEEEGLLYPELKDIRNVESLALLEDKLLLVHDGGTVKVLRSEKLLTNGNVICTDEGRSPEEDEGVDEGEGGEGGEGEVEIGEEGDPTEPGMGSGVVEDEEVTDPNVIDENGEDMTNNLPDAECKDGMHVEGTKPLAEGEFCSESDEEIAAAMDLREIFKNSKDCEGPIGVQSFEPLQLSGVASAQRFSILNTTCGAAVLGRSGVDSAAPAVVLSLEGAADIKFDPLGQRLFVAEGAQGLRVRYTGSISQNLSAFNSLDKKPEQLSAKVGEISSSCAPVIRVGDESFGNNTGTPVNNNNIGDNNNGDNDNIVPPVEPPGTFVTPPEPIFDTEQAQAVIDPSLQDQINVTSVNFDADRVFFINGANGADAPTTSLVVARLTPANTLESRESLELPVQDLEEASVHYKITPLHDNLLLVVREATSGLQAWVVDAPVGRAPQRVLTLPTDKDTLAVVTRDDRVSVVRNAGMQSWTLRATGGLR